MIPFSAHLSNRGNAAKTIQLGSRLAMALGCLVIARASEGVVTVVDQPELGQTNRFYAGNRAPLRPSPFLKLPVGAIEPRGWLRRQLQLQSDGFHGHLAEISRFLRREHNAWLSPSGEGSNGWEEVPYWLKGFANCAYLLGREDQMAEARVWIDAVLGSQRADGYFGPRPGQASTVESTQGKYDLWPNMVMLMCLQSWYEYSQDERVLPFLSRYFRWELAVPKEDFLPPFWQQQRAADNLWSVYWLYNRTGEPWLLELARKIHERTANWTDGIASWHNVNASQAFGGPTFFWIQSGDPRHLAGSERNWQTLRRLYGQVPGGMFGGDENCRPGFTDPRQAVETCGLVEMMFSHERLLTVTGDPIWADRCEDVAFNSLPAALLADFTALRYLTAPNLIRSDRHSKAPGLQNDGPMLHYNPHLHRCCQHNFGHGWPYFTEHLWLATPDEGLAAVCYAASQVTAKVGDGTEIRLSADTRYPFAEEITLRLSAPGPVTFPLYLRIPGWCEQPALRINGQRHPVKVRAPGYVKIARRWTEGDSVRLRLPMTIRLRAWEDNHHSVSVDRGPLTYSLKIGERLVREGGTARWPAWEIHPTTPWNYGLVLKSGRPENSFRVVTKPWPTNDMPFTHEGCPVELTGQGRRIPEWQADDLGLVGQLQASPVRSTEPTERISLLPMGAARLRIASFPVIGQGPEARPWRAPAPTGP